MKTPIELLADWVSQIETRVETINDRTKIHTIRIKNIEKKLKENEK